ncbi:hypothetical protein SAMN04487894_105253 [Niabella drilacis]|uniref:Uncharacterized protein n=1 Tax=Niabella drilacis (strain DSM 25811 / CCM 8410 / CCUG 62505 / LMG 26954 / E90) TaxID=1285928 RepID=A0A1G6REU5_NIADE|nr:hypothetical protein SAMN04487894_105253 [Niabella drilacis]
MPILASGTGLLILLYGIYTGRFHTKLTAYAVLLIAATGGIIAFATGEAAEATVKQIREIARNRIEEHEEFATITVVAVIVPGIAALIAIYST